MEPLGVSGCCQRTQDPDHHLHWECVHPLAFLRPGSNTRVMHVCRGGPGTRLCSTLQHTFPCRSSPLHLHPHLLPLLQLLPDAVDLLGQELVVGLSAGGCLKHGLLHLHGILDETAHSLVLESMGVLDWEYRLNSVRERERERERKVSVKFLEIELQIKKEKFRQNSIVK